MALVTPDIKIALYLSDDTTELLLQDITGLYSSTNPLGYNLPGGLTLNSVTSVTVTLNYTQLSVTSVFVFTIASGVITAATLSFALATPVSILSELESTVWPFGPTNNFNLVGDYGVDIPEFTEMVYQCTYEVEGSYISNVYDYSTEELRLVDTETCCCISKGLINANMSDINENEMTPYMRAKGFLMTAQSAAEDGDITKSNNYLIRAAAICNDNCDCGCS